MSTSVGRWSAFNISMRAAEAVAVELVALLEQHDQLLEEPADPLGLDSASPVTVISLPRTRIVHRERGLDHGAAARRAGRAGPP